MMMIKFSTHIIIFFMLSLVSNVSFAALNHKHSTVSLDVKSSLIVPEKQHLLFIAEVESDTSPVTEQLGEPSVDSGGKGDMEKKCMTICEKWGEKSVSLIPVRANVNADVHARNSGRNASSRVGDNPHKTCCVCVSLQSLKLTFTNPPLSDVYTMWFEFRLGK